MGNKQSYTDVVAMISDQLDRFDSRIDKMDYKMDTQLRRIEDKLDETIDRVTIIETESKSNYRWLGWVAAAAVTFINIFMHFKQ